MNKAEVGVDIGLSTFVDLTGEGKFVWLATELSPSVETFVVAWGMEDVFEPWLEGFALSCVMGVEDVPRVAAFCVTDSRLDKEVKGALDLLEG